DVQIMALDLAARRLRAIDGLHAIQEAIAPVHERLRVDVLVVLREVKPTLQRLVHNATVVLPRESELRLHRRTEQRSAEFVETLALDDDAGRRSVERLQIRRRDAHVLEAQRFQRLEPEDVAD